MIHIHDLANVEFSDTVTLLTPDGGVWNAFQMLTRAARVVFHDGRVVIVAFPKCSAMLPEHDFVDEAVEAAVDKAAGEVVYL